MRSHKDKTHSESKRRKYSSASDVFERLEPAHNDDRIDRSHIIGNGVKVLAQWCLRLLIIAAATYVGWLVVKTVWAGVLPVILAIIVCTVLWPPVAALRKIGVPNALAVITAMLGAFGIFGGIIYLIAPDIGRQSQTLYYQAIEGIQRVQLWLQGPPLNIDDQQLADRINDAVQWLQNQAGSIAGEIFSGIGIATTIIVTIVIMLVLTFFFLKDGERFLPWLRSIAGERAGWHLTELLTRAWNTLGGFIRAQAIVSFVDSVFIGIGLLLVGVPLAFALAVLTFIAGFIPIVGAFVAGALAVLVALVSLGFTEALITLGIVLAVQQIEGNILSPLLQSKAMNLHPVIILVSVTVGTGLFNITGAFLAVPVAAMVAVLFRYLGDLTALRAGEKTADEIEFATVAGSMSGIWGEEAGRRMREAFHIQLRRKSNVSSADIATEEANKAQAETDIASAMSAAVEAGGVSAPLNPEATPTSAASTSVHQEPGNKAHSAASKLKRLSATLAELRNGHFSPKFKRK